MDKLEDLRKKIDVLDVQLVQLLHERLSVVEEIGILKKELGLNPLDAKRWNHVVSKSLDQAESLGLKKEFVKKILDTIHAEALQIERKI